MIPKDIEQANLMVELRIKIDVWSYGIDEQLRQRSRATLMNLYLQLPCRRVWLYLKSFRGTLLRDPNDQNLYGEEALMDGPEDIIAKGKSAILQISM